jgi:hypothetical protein
VVLQLPVADVEQRQSVDLNALAGWRDPEQRPGVGAATPPPHGDRGPFLDHLDDLDAEVREARPDQLDLLPPSLRSRGELTIVGPLCVRRHELVESSTFPLQASSMNR